MLTKGIVGLVFLGGAVLVQASSLPASTCSAYSDDSGYSCTLNSANGSGGFNGDVTVTLPSGVASSAYSSGTTFLVLDTNPGNITTDQNNEMSDSNQADWSQVLEITGGTVQLFTTGCANGTSGDSCFPSLASIMASGNYTFSQAGMVGGTYAYNFNGDNYYIGYDLPTVSLTKAPVTFLNTVTPDTPSTPEPATLFIAGSGMLALFVMRRRAAASGR